MAKKTILCVDDEKIILDSLKSQLKRRYGTDFDYEVALGAEEALEIVDEFSEEGITILIIVSDWLMPGIKGDEFLINIHKRYPKIIKFMLTGQADQESIDNAYKNANLYCCLSKPWNEQELYEAIDSALEENCK
jgi:DNA-binding NtrC family response regulator